MKKLHIAALVLALAFGLSACGGEGAQTPSEAPVETATPTPTATPTASPEATATPTPTPTPSPTAEPTPEPSPEATAAPTPSPTPKATPAPVNTPAPTPTPQAIKEPEVPQLNLSENAEKNVNIPDQSALNYADSPIPGLPVIPDGPKDGSSGTGVTDDTDRALTDEEVWDPERKVDTYLN